MTTEVHELPEVGEIVVATISKITAHGAYATLHDGDAKQPIWEHKEFFWTFYLLFLSKKCFFINLTYFTKLCFGTVQKLVEKKILYLHNG